MTNTYNWYENLVKPWWAPPSWLFGTVWPFLYLIIAISFFVVFYKSATRQIPMAVSIPFALNLLFNFSFSPIQFGLKNNFLASVNITLVVVTLLWAFVAIWPYMRWTVYANLPYLLWGLFATALQFSITYLNR